MKKFALFTLVSVILPLVVAVSTVYLVHYRFEKSEIQVEDTPKLQLGIYENYDNNIDKQLVFTGRKSVHGWTNSYLLKSFQGSYEEDGDYIIIDKGNSKSLFYIISDSTIVEVGLNTVYKRVGNVKWSEESKEMVITK